MKEKWKKSGHYATLEVLERFASHSTGILKKVSRKDERVEIVGLEMKKLTKKKTRKTNIPWTEVVEKIFGSTLTIKW